MKVGLICFGNLKEAPYIRVYTDILREHSIPFDLIYWDRNGEGEVSSLCPSKTYAWKETAVNASSLYSKIIKIPKMLRYGRFVESIAKKEDYDYLVVFTSLLGVILQRYLTKNYKKRYVFDIRDHSYEQFPLFYRRMDMLMKNSAMNVISSVGFREFLPKYETIICHNYSIYANPDEVKPIKKNDSINISYIGLVRYSNEYIDFLRKIANNPRINFHFYGYGGHVDRIKQMCKSEGINNVYFHGPFKIEEKPHILNETDVVFNVYGNDLHVKYAVSNKYYDALVFSRPIIVSPETTMERITQGFSYSFDKDFDVHQFLLWYDSLDSGKVYSICTGLLEQVNNDRALFSTRLVNTLLSNE